MGIGKALLVPLVLGLNGYLGLWALDAVLPEEDEPGQVAVRTIHGSDVVALQPFYLSPFNRPVPRYIDNY